MFDVLLAVAADPMSWPVWVVLLFSAAMYPVGVMLGSDCSACCGCGLCVGGKLPDTVTVSISGYADGQVPGPDLATLVFESNFGGGAAGKVTSPGGAPGPISAVAVTNGGEGYARLKRAAPTLTASASGGTGATFDVEVSPNGTTPETWRVSGVTLTAGGSGYPASGSLKFNPGSGDVEVTAANAYFYCGTEEPAVSVEPQSAGSGASLTPTLSSTTWGNQTYWYVSDINIDDGGSGYSEGDYIGATVTDGQSGQYSWFYAFVSSVDENGAITGVTIYYGGEFYKSTGIIESVALSVWWRGSYYKDDTSAPGEAATVTVSVQQKGPAPAAAGAVLTAVIDTDPAHIGTTFGTITGVTIEDGGDGYLAWAYRNAKCCEDYFNGLTLVLRRLQDNKCQYLHKFCGPTCISSVSVFYNGPESPPTVGIHSVLAGRDCSAWLTSTEIIENCDDFSFTATNESGITAVVSVGGEYDALNKADNASLRCFTCCRAESDPPEEIEVEVSQRWYWEDANAAYGPPIYMDEIPTVVLRRRRDLGQFTAEWIGLLPNEYIVQVAIYECNDPLKDDCDHCWKKCQTRAAITTIFNCYGTSAPDRGVSPPCVSCEESPMCKPVAGDYVITQNVYGDSLCNLRDVKVSVL